MIHKTYKPYLKDEDKKIGDSLVEPPIFLYRIFNSEA